MLPGSESMGSYSVYTTAGSPWTAPGSKPGAQSHYHLQGSWQAGAGGVAAVQCTSAVLLGPQS